MSRACEHVRVRDRADSRHRTDTGRSRPAVQLVSNVALSVCLGCVPRYYVGAPIWGLALCASSGIMLREKGPFLHSLSSHGERISGNLREHAADEHAVRLQLRTVVHYVRAARDAENTPRHGDARFEFRHPWYGLKRTGQHAHGI